MTDIKSINNSFKKAKKDTKVLLRRIYKGRISDVLANREASSIITRFTPIRDQVLDLMANERNNDLEGQYDEITMAIMNNFSRSSSIFHRLTTEFHAPFITMASLIILPIQDAMNWLIIDQYTDITTEFLDRIDDSINKTVEMIAQKKKEQVQAENALHSLPEEILANDFIELEGDIEEEEIGTTLE